MKVGEDAEGDPIYETIIEYRTYYWYLVWEWCYARSVVTSGNGDLAPVWGDTVLSDYERESGRSCIYELYVVTRDDKRKSCRVDEDTWYSIGIGERRDFNLYRWRQCVADSIKTPAGVFLWGIYCGRIIVYGRIQ